MNYARLNSVTVILGASCKQLGPQIGARDKIKKSGAFASEPLALAHHLSIVSSLACLLLLSIKLKPADSNANKVCRAHTKPEAIENFYY